MCFSAVLSKSCGDFLFYFLKYFDLSLAVSVSGFWRGGRLEGRCVIGAGLCASAAGLCATGASLERA